MQLSDETIVSDNVLATLEKATEEAGAKSGVFSTAPAIKNYFANFLSEIIGTMALTLGILFYRCKTKLLMV